MVCPGVGKTALAVHAAHLLKDRFPDRQLFIDLHAYTPGQDPMLPEAALAGLLTAVGVDARYLPPDLEGRAVLWRDRMVGQRVLLVLDNAASSDQVTPLLPRGGGFLVLVTSRKHLGDLPGSVVPVLLDALPPDKAREMFLRLVPSAATAPEKAVEELVRLTGYLPLAIWLLARVYARHPAWTLADLIGETRASMLTLTAEGDNVAAAFDVSYRYLSPGRQQFFRRLGLHPGTTIDAYAAAALVGLPLRQAYGHLDALHGEGLLTEVGYRRYGMHDLIRRYAQDLAATDSEVDRSQGLEHLLDYYQHTAAICEALLARRIRTSPAAAAATSPPAAVPDLSDRPQALAWARAERVSLIACLEYATRSGQHARVTAFAAAIASLLRQDGPWTDAITIHTTAVQAARHLGDRLDQANALNNLGDARLATGDYRGAAEVLEEALSIYRDLGNQLGVASALNDLGVVRLATGDYPGGTEALEEALGICRDLGERLGVANALNYLGSARRLTGDYPGAAQALEEAVDIYRDLGDRAGEAEALNEVGTLHRVQGDLDLAEASHRQSLALAREIGSSWNEGHALAGLGRCARAAGRTADAEPDLRQAWEIFQRSGAAEAAGVAAELDALTNPGPTASM